MFIFFAATLLPEISTASLPILIKLIFFRFPSEKSISSASDLVSLNSTFPNLNFDLNKLRESSEFVLKNFAFFLSLLENYKNLLLP